MTTLLLEFAIRTSLIAAGTATVLWMLRIKTASVRHAAWSAVVITMLLLPVWLAAGVHVSLPVLTPAPATTQVEQPNVAIPPATRTVPSIAESVSDDQTATSSPVRTPAAPLDWRAFLMGAYLTGASFLLLRLIVGTVQANRLRRAAVVVDGRLTSDRCTTPITVGWFKPVLILPRGWTDWAPAQLDVVLAHEHEHARRHDPLVQWLALLNRAVFWFHPLSWWLERKLAALAESACDATVIASGHSPQDYAECLLEMARSLTRAGRRLNVVGMEMPGSSLKRRVRQIFNGLPMTPLSPVRVSCTVIFCVMSSVIFAAGTPARRSTQQQTLEQKFDLATIKPCPRDAVPPPGRSGGWPKRAQVSPDLARWECLTVEDLVFLAYARSDTTNRLLNNKNVRRPDDPEPVRGGPSWARSERFTIEAKATAVADQATLTGPMLRTLLEDRFQLKTHRATEDQPVYVLTLTKAGLNRDKVKPTAPGDCVTRVPGVPLPPAGQGGYPCGGQNFAELQGGVKRVIWTGTTLKDFLNVNGGLMDRVVIDRTGIDGQFNIQFDFVPDDRTPGYPWPTDSSAAGTGRSVFKALEEIGLHLEPSKAPAEYIAIDRVERPKSNDADADVMPSPRGQGSGPFVPEARQTGQTVPPPAVPAMPIKYEAVLIKPCDPSAQSGGGRGAGVSQRFAISPGYASWGCVTLEQLIDLAWGGGTFPNNALANTIRVPPGWRPDAPKRIRGGPSWIDDERFEIEIRLSGDTTNLTGSAHHNAVANAMLPALRAMLADRFQLKLQKMTEEQPMYALAVAKTGLTITSTAPERCWERSRFVRPEDAVPPPGFEGVLPCDFGAERGQIGGNTIRTFTNITLRDFAAQLSQVMDRYVLDKTGVAGRFTLRLEYASDDSTPDDAQSSDRSARAFAGLTGQPRREPVKGDGPTIFKALEKFGLKLEPTKGPAEYLVVQSAQRPTPSSATFAAAGGGR